MRLEVDCPLCGAPMAVADETKTYSRQMMRVDLRCTACGHKEPVWAHAEPRDYCQSDEPSTE